MNIDISIDSLMMAIKSVQRDIKRHEELAQDTNLSDDDLDYYGQYVLDLTKVYGELGMAYQEAQKQYPECPLLEELTKRL